MFNKRLFLTKRRRRSNRFLDLIRLIQSLNPVVAYSTSRRLSSSADKLMRVRLDSDNSEIDIGFVGGILDTQSLIDFGGYNLLGYTEDLTHSSWFTFDNGTSNIESGLVDPFGGNGAYRFSTSGGSKILAQSILQNIFTGDQFTGSLFYRNSTHPNNVLRMFRATGVGSGDVESSIVSMQQNTTEWQRIDVTHSFQNNQIGIRFDVLVRSGSSVEIFAPQLTKGSDLLPYQSRTAGGASDCFVTTWYDQIGSNHATQPVATNQPKIYDVLSGDIIRENGKPAMVFDGAGDHLSIPNIAGRSNTDAYFVNRHDDTSATAIDNEAYLYPTGNGAGNFGFVGVKNSTTASLNSSSYGSPSLYKNNTLLSPTNRGEVYSLLGQTQNIINHQGASTSSWTEYQYGRYDAGQGVFHFEGTLQEIIIFDNNLTPDNRQKLHDDINDHYDIF